MSILGKAKALVRENRAAFAAFAYRSGDRGSENAFRKMLIQQMASGAASIYIRAAEFKVFSQFGEDGIIQYLIRRADIPPQLRTFVEFGVRIAEDS